MGVLTRGFVLRRLENLERALQIDDSEEVIDIVLWEGNKGGLFGHLHIKYHRYEGKNEFVPCSVEEELELMRDAYERDGRHVFGNGDEVSFADYLKSFCYLGPEALSAEREAVIERLRGEVNGA